MGEDAQGTESAATTLTDGTASTATTQAEGAAQVAAPTEAEATPASPEDIWAKVAELDLDELIRRNPRLQGKVGSLAQQQSQRAISEFQTRQTAELAEQAKRTERAELARLAREDPDALAARVVTDLAKTEFEENNRSQAARAVEAEHTKLANELNALYEKPIVKELWDQADADTRAKMTWTNYNTISEFMEVMSDVISDYRAEKKVGTKAEELAKKRFEAMVKESKIEGVKSDAETAASDLNLDGLSSSEHIYTPAEIAAMTLEEYRQVKTKIRAQAAAGYIKPSR